MKIAKITTVYIIFATTYDVTDYDKNYIDNFNSSIVGRLLPKTVMNLFLT